MLVDTHAHLEMNDYDEDREEVLRRALKSGVRQIVAVGIDRLSSHKSIKLAKRYDFIFATVGYHPHNAKDVNAQVLDELARLAAEPETVAWGEIGLDFYRRHSPPTQQIDAFESQLDLASSLHLPVIIHSREANSDVFEILKKRKGRVKGVIHCFSGDLNLAFSYIDMGYYISIPGTVTYKKASLVREVAAHIPLERLLLETDAPFLSPEPKRGKRNEPSFVVHTAERIAELRQLEFEAVASQTTENARQIFSLPLL
jgi:TatD DNase family protein